MLLLYPCREYYHQLINHFHIISYAVKLMVPCFNILEYVFPIHKEYYTNIDL